MQHKTLAAYSNNSELTPFSHIHNHETINRNLLCPERVYHEFAKHNVRHEIINILNTFPVDITSKIHTHSLFGYVTYIKTYFYILILVIFSTVIFVVNNVSLCVVLCPTFSYTLGYVRVYLPLYNVTDGPFHVRR